MEQEAIIRHKKELRAQLRQKRRAGDPSQFHDADARIAQQLCALPEWKRAQMVLSYLSVEDEVDTRALIQCAWDHGKAVALPRVIPHTRRMDWYLIDDFDHLEQGSFDIEEPPVETARLVRVGDENMGVVPMLAVVPGLTFDHAGYRLGYGGGYYDTFLAAFAGDAIGLCREAQLAADLSAQGVLDAHDQAVVCVVTEERVLRIRA